MSKAGFSEFCSSPLPSPPLQLLLLLPSLALFFLLFSRLKEDLIRMQDKGGTSVMLFPFLSHLCFVNTLLGLF